RLTHPARAGERHQPVGGQAQLHLLDFGLAPEKSGDLERQVMSPSTSCWRTVRLLSEAIGRKWHRACHGPWQVANRNVRQQAKLSRACERMALAFDTELAVHVLDVEFDRTYSQRKLLGNFGRGETLSQERQYLPLPPGQRL